MVDDTIISVVSKSKVVYVAFEPLLRRILYVWVFMLQHTYITNIRKLELFTVLI